MNFHIISSSFTFPYLISRVNQVPLDLTGDPTSIIYYGAGAITIFSLCKIFLNLLAASNFEARVNRFLRAISTTNL